MISNSTSQTPTINWIKVHMLVFSFFFFFPSFTFLIDSNLHCNRSGTAAGSSVPATYPASAHAEALRAVHLPACFRDELALRTTWLVHDKLVKEGRRECPDTLVLLACMHLSLSWSSSFWRYGYGELRTGTGEPWAGCQGTGTAPAVLGHRSGEGRKAARANSWAEKSILQSRTALSSSDIFTVSALPFSGGYRLPPDATILQRREDHRGGGRRHRSLSTGSRDLHLHRGLKTTVSPHAPYQHPAATRPDPAPPRSSWRRADVCRSALFAWSRRLWSRAPPGSPGSAPLSRQDGASGDFKLMCRNKISVGFRSFL